MRSLSWRAAQAEQVRGQGSELRKFPPLYANSDFPRFPLPPLALTPPRRGSDSWLVLVLVQRHLQVHRLQKI